MVIRAPTYFRNWARDPGVAIRSQEYVGQNNRLNNLLQGQDKFFGPPGMGPDYDWPNPRGPIPSIVLRTHIDQTRRHLIGQDQFFGPPGMGPAYDWPNPRGRAFSIDLRTFINPTATQLIPVFPFALDDWPVPKGRAFPVDLRTFLNATEIQLIGLDQFFGAPGQPAPNRDWPVPKGPPFSLDARTWLVNLQQTTFASLNPPIRLSDWPNPRGPLFPISLRTWIDPFKILFQPVLPPFAQSDWPNPRGPQYPIALRTFVYVPWLTILVNIGMLFASFDGRLQARGRARTFTVDAVVRRSSLTTTFRTMIVRPNDRS